MRSIFPFSKIFHRASRIPVPEGVTIMPLPKETPVYYKRYPKNKVVDLPEPKEIENNNIFKLIKKRKSIEPNSTPPNLSELSTLLKYSLGEIPKEYNNVIFPRRMYPAGGARYTAEAYIVQTIDGEDLKQGVYHYDVKNHRLEIVFDKEFDEKEKNEMVIEPWGPRVPMFLVITAVFERKQIKYSERGYRYILIDAGHIGQNVYLLAGALGLKCRSIGGVNEDKMEEIIDVDGESEGIVYTISLGQ